MDNEIGAKAKQNHWFLFWGRNCTHKGPISTIGHNQTTRQPNQ
jgi:hypothetical protein